MVFPRLLRVAVVFLFGGLPRLRETFEVITDESLITLRAFFAEALQEFFADSRLHLEDQRTSRRVEVFQGRFHRELAGVVTFQTAAWFRIRLERRWRSVRIFWPLFGCSEESPTCMACNRAAICIAF